MKTMFKAFWLMIALLALNACKKTVTEEPIPLDQNKFVFVNDESGGFYAVNAQTGLLLWKRNTEGAGGSYISSPAVTQDAVVFADRGNEKLFCFNTPDGTVKWNKNYVYAGYYASPVIMNNIAYVPNYSDYFEKITGYTLGGGVAVKEFMVPNDNDANSLNIVKDLYVMATCGGHLFGVSQDGIKQWEYRSNTGCYHNNPAINDGVIYILSSSGKLSAVKAATGMEVWSRMVGEMVENASVVYNNGMLFIAGYYSNNKIYAFSAADGALKHTYQMPEGGSFYYYYNTPAVNDGKLFMLSQNGILVAFDVNNENILWQKDFGISGSGRMQAQITFHNRTESIAAMSSVVVANNTLYLTVGKTMYAVNLKGDIMWQFSADDYIYSSPVVLSNYNKAYRGGNAGVVVQ